MEKLRKGVAEVMRFRRVECETAKKSTWQRTEARSDGAKHEGLAEQGARTITGRTWFMVLYSPVAMARGSRRAGRAKELADNRLAEPCRRRRRSWLYIMSIAELGSARTSRGGVMVDGLRQTPGPSLFSIAIPSVFTLGSYPDRKHDMSHEALPIDRARFAEALESLPLDALHSKVAELRNNIQHLRSSNDQMVPFADEGDQGSS